MGKAIHKPASMFLAMGALEKALARLQKEQPDEDLIGVGRHDQGGVVVTIGPFPKFAAVSRDEGTAGDGFDKGASGPPFINPLAVLLIALKNLDMDGSTEFWAKIVREAHAFTGDPMTLIPPELTQALTTVQAELPKVTGQPSRTSRQRNGDKEAEIVVSRPRVKQLAKK